MPVLNVRAAALADAAAINRIYNHYVLRTTATFDTEAWTQARRETWLAEFAPPYFLLVAEVENKITGFAFNRGFRAKPAYSRSTETTVYTDAAQKISGAGRALYQKLFAQIADTDLHRAYAVIALPNPASVAFHERFGFRRAGVLSEVGYKFGGYVDTAWFEKLL